MSAPEDCRTIGPLMMASSALFFAFTALFVRLGSESTPVGMIVLVRFVLMSAALVALRATGAISVRPRNKRLLVYRSVCAAASGVFFFYSVATISIAEAIILKYTYPVFAVTVSAFVYGERTRPVVLAVLAMSLAGVVVMMNPSHFHPSIGYLWGLLNGLAAGIAVAFLRQLRLTDDSATVLYWYSLTGVVISLPFIAQGLRFTGVEGTAYTLLAALSGTLGQFAIVFGFKYIKTGRGSVIMTLEVVLSSLLAFLFLRQIPGPFQIAGGALIIAGALAVSGEGAVRREA